MNWDCIYIYIYNPYWEKKIPMLRTIHEIWRIRLLFTKNSAELINDRIKFSTFKIISRKMKQSELWEIYFVKDKKTTCIFCPLTFVLLNLWKNYERSYICLEKYSQVFLKILKGLVLVLWTLDYCLTQAHGCSPCGGHRTSALTWRHISFPSCFYRHHFDVRNQRNSNFFWNSRDTQKKKKKTRFEKQP